MSEIDWSKAPEGATHYAPKREENCMYRAVFWRIVGDIGVEAWSINDDGSIQYYGRPAWIASDLSRLIPRPATPAWSGDGLPPVGAYIEWLSAQYGWLGGRVVGHDGMVTVVSHNDGYTGCHAHEVRPIRTPEQIAAEERENAVKEMETVAAKAWRETPIGMDMITEICSALYDAGFQVPKQ